MTTALDEVSTKPARFRALLREPRPLLLCGVHDGLSAFLAEQAGFSALWASGFCISTTKRIPDVGLVTMSEFLAVCREIERATSVPVIADVDDGYGDAVNVVRTVREYEAAGIAGICMEDNAHPKRNSLDPALRSRMVPAEEFAGKVAAAAEVRKDADFAVIARTESLTAGSGIDEALRRASLYEEAGADLIVVHSRAKTAGPIREFARAWRGSVPLVAIPTTYPSATARDLYELGYAVSIFANQALRAAIPAMKAVFDRMLRTGSIADVDDQLCPLAEMFAVAGFDEVRRIEAGLAAPRGPDDA